MFKKSFVLGAGLVLLLALFFGRSHVLTTIGMVKQSVKESVPIDFEIKRAQQMINDLRPEIARNLRLVIAEEVEVSKLEDHVLALAKRLEKDGNDIVRLNNDLQDGSDIFVYAGLSYTKKQVKAELETRFDQYNTEKATLESQKQILAARQQALQAAREKLQGMEDAKRRLEVDIENLAARLAMVEVAQTTSHFKFDDSHLSRTEELISDISTRIEVAEKLVNADSRPFKGIQLDEPEEGRDITEEVAEAFGTNREAFVTATRNIELDE